MAEHLVFARKASGLVRGLDMWDAFGAGLMTCQPIATLWLMVGIALSLYPTGNLLISIAIGAVTAGIGAPLVWGILSGSMPRAGGEYVYNSRILHPAIALGAVFCNIIAIFYWNWYIATWLGVPALQLWAQYMGLWSFADWCASNTGLVVLGLIAVIVGFVSVAFSMKSYALIQKIMLIPAIGGVIVLIVALFLSSKADFIANWNSIATEYKSLELRAPSSRPPARCPTAGTGAARSAPSAASTRCSSTTTRSPTSAARSSARTRRCSAPTSSPCGRRSSSASSPRSASTASWRSTS